MKQVFVSEDGRNFDSAEACQRYEATMGQRATVERWANTVYGTKRGQSTRATNAVLNWEADRDAVNNGTFPFQAEPAVQAA